MGYELETDDGTVIRRRRKDLRDHRKHRQRIIMFLYFIMGTSNAVSIMSTTPMSSV